jgi:hypothetical protein
VSVVSDFGLGRRREPEPKMAQFPLQDLLRAGVVRRPHTRFARFTPILDQQAEGTCVGQTGKSALVTAPRIWHRGIMDKPTAHDLYTLACDNDEWRENDGGHDRQFGSSIRGLARGMRAANLISAFHWTDRVDIMADFIGGVDASGKPIGWGVLLGLNWYYSMFAVNADGFLTIPDGTRVAGGHAIYCDEWDDRGGWAGGPNSWGYRFGKVVKGRPNGRWKMSGETLQRLLSEQGECCAIVEVGKV